MLKLSRVEGMFGPPLEGFHMGATCVVTAVTGHEEYVEHGENGLVVDWDDVRGTAARSTCWPATARCCTACAGARWRPRAAGRRGTQQGTVMAAALREVARREPLAGRPFDARLLAELRGGIERHALVAAERDRLRYRAAPMHGRRPRARAPGRRAGWRARRDARGAPRAGGCGDERGCGAGSSAASSPRRAARAAQRVPRGG